MTAQDSSPPSVDRIIEVHDDAESSSRQPFVTAVVGTVAVVMLAASIGGALAAGNLAFTVLLAAVTVLFGAAVATGALQGR